MNHRFFRWFRHWETRVHELNYLFWECTTRCNLHCRHCGSDCGRGQREPDMPLEDFLSALDTIPQKPKGFTVVLTGGEPLLRPDIADCGRALRQRGVGWGMVSNGFFYDEVTQQKLLEAGLGALTISLDGLKEEHNRMRGHRDSFDRATRAISLAALAPGLAFDVVTCVHQRNLPQLPEIHALLKSMNVRRWRLFTIIPIGRAASEPGFQLSPAQTVQLMEFIRAHRGGEMDVSFSCEGYLGRYEEQVRNTPFFCHAGINIASVLADGRICACPDIDREVFSQGNIYRDSLWEVWNTRFKPFRDRSWARMGSCAHCPAFKDCEGGGMHNWKGECKEPLTCIYQSINQHYA